MEYIWTMLMHKILQNHHLGAFVANLKIGTIYALYPESFCDKNLAIRKVFVFVTLGEKAHKCYQCLPCVHAPSFKIQMRTHMGEISYKCSQCNCTCTRVTNLHTHMLTHTEVRAFNCDQCIKYIIKHSLSQAQIYEHKEPTFLNMRSPWFFA